VQKLGYVEFVRTGFERMVADVCLGKVGAVAARSLGLCPQQP
jgi:hypothetical protein